MSCVETGTCGTGSCLPGQVTLPGDPIMSSATLTAVAAFGGIEVKWSLPEENLGGLSRIYVYRSTVNDVDTAGLLATVAGDSYTDREVTGGITYFYWIQMLSVQGSLGPKLGPISCTAAETYTQILDEIAGRIEMSDLSGLLRTEIARINTISDDLFAETNNRILLETNLTSTVQSLQNSYSGTYSDIINKQNSLTDDTQSLATEINRIVAGYGDMTFAHIVNDYYTSAQADIAIANAILELEAGMDDASQLIATALVDYSTTVDMNSAIASATTDLQSSNDVDNKLATALIDYSTTTDMNTAIAAATIGLQSESDVNNAISSVLVDYTTTVDMNSAISTATTGLQSSSDVNNAISSVISNYSTTVEMGEAISTATLNLQSGNDVDDKIATVISDYSTTTDMNSAIASATLGLQSANDVDNSIATALTNYSTTSEVGSAISTATTGLTSTSDVNSAIASALNSYSTTVDMNSAIATATVGLQTESDVDNKVASALTHYSTTLEMDSAIATATTGLQSATEVNNAIAYSLTDYYTSTDTDDAIASNNTTLVSGIDGYSGSVDILAQTINGLSSRWEVKTTVNDLVGSVGFYNNGSDIIFAITDGAEGLSYNVTQDKLTMNGAITLLPGSSGYGELADKPSELSDINTSESTKLTGIQAGATVGATWGSNLNNVPSNLSSLTGAEAINNADITVASLGAETPSGAQAKANVAETNAKNYADTTFVLASTHTTDIADLQSQIDGNITSWFYSGAPTLANAPANTWTSNADKDMHLGDLYYDDVTGYAYRFKVETGTYSWQQLSDSDITAALQLANTAQDTADAKRRVFITTPSGPYDAGDLWDNGSVVRRATTDRVSGYSASEWVEIANYVINTSQLTDDDNLGGTADWSGINDDDGNKPANGADVTNYSDPRIDNNIAAPYTLKSSAGMVVNGSSVYASNTATAWGDQVYTSEAYLGGAFVSFVVDAANFIVALNTDPTTDAGRDSLDFGIYVYNATAKQIRIRESGTDQGQFGNWEIGDVLSITYDGSNVKYLKNGTVIKTTPAAANLKLHMDSSFVGGGGFSSLQFGPYSSSEWDALKNLPDRLTDSATTGLNLTATHMGYFDGSSWRTYMDNVGNRYVGGTTFTQAGIQEEYNEGNPRYYCGDGNEKFFKYSNGELEIGKDTILQGFDSYGMRDSFYINHIFMDATQYIVDSQYTTYSNDLLRITSNGGYAYIDFFDNTQDAFLLNKVTFSNSISFKTKLKIGGVQTYSGTFYLAVGTVARPFNTESSFGFEFRSDGTIWVAYSTAGGGQSNVVNSGGTWIEDEIFEIEARFAPTNADGNRNITFYKDGSQIHYVEDDPSDNLFDLPHVNTIPYYHLAARIETAGWVDLKNIKYVSHPMA